MEGSGQPHVVMFPYPAQGHINPMMQLAQRLLGEGVAVTFVNTEFNHVRMFKGAEASVLLETPNLRFESLPDGLPPNHGRFNQSVVEMTAAILMLPGPMAKLVQRIIAGAGAHYPPPTCIISDSFCHWMQDVADIVRLPRVSLWTTPLHANLAYHFQEDLQSRGLIPIKDPGSLSTTVSCVPGIEPLPLRDYISFFLVPSTEDFLYQWHLRMCMRRPREAIWNLGNNFADLEPTALHAWTSLVPNFVPIGPLIPRSVIGGDGDGSGHGGAGPSLWPEEKSSCIEWLDLQPPKSVLYISFGSIATMSDDEIGALIQGLEDSGAPFLLSIRPDQGGAAVDRLRARLHEEILDENAHVPPFLLVSWAPQLAVLAHPSVGCFFSHCGWNSIVEALCTGIPILAKPGGFAEQRMNAHYIAEVWKIGLALPPLASPKVVKGLVQDLLGESAAGDAIRSRISALRASALEAISPPSGSSHTNFHSFVADLRKRASASPAQERP